MQTFFQYLGTLSRREPPQIDTPIDLKIDNLLSSFESFGMVGIVSELNYEEVLLAHARLCRAAETLLKAENLKDETKCSTEFPMNYFDCEKIFQRLRSKEELFEKDWLGRMKLKEMREFLDAMDAMKKNNLHLVHVVRVVENVHRVALPSLRTQIRQIDKTVSDAGKRTVVLSKKAEMHKSRFREACRDRNIAGMDIELELRSQVVQIPGMLNNILNGLKELHSSIEYGQKFLVSTGQKSEFMKFVENLLAKSSCDDTRDQIKSVQEIENWKIEIESSSASSSTSSHALVDPENRLRVEEDLLEARAFFTQRLAEVAFDENDDLLQIWGGRSAVHESKKSISGELEKVEKVLSMLRDPKLEDLFVIQANGPNFRRIRDELEHLRSLEGRALRSAEILEESNKSQIEKRRSLMQDQEDLVWRMKEVLQQLQKAMTKQLKRPCHVIW